MRESTNSAQRDELDPLTKYDVRTDVSQQVEMA
jgi:hypothetical protein